MLPAIAAFKCGNNKLSEIILVRSCYHCRDCFIAAIEKNQPKLCLLNWKRGVHGTGVEGEEAGNRAHITHINAGYTEPDNQPSIRTRLSPTHVPGILSMVS